MICAFSCLELVIRPVVNTGIFLEDRESMRDCESMCEIMRNVDKAREMS